MTGFLGSKNRETTFLGDLEFTETIERGIIVTRFKDFCIVQRCIFTVWVENDDESQLSVNPDDFSITNHNVFHQNDQNNFIGSL